MLMIMNAPIVRVKVFISFQRSSRIANIALCYNVSTCYNVTQHSGCLCHLVLNVINCIHRVNFCKNFWSPQIRDISF